MVSHFWFTKDSSPHETLLHIFQKSQLSSFSDKCERQMNDKEMKQREQKNEKKRIGQ